MKEIRQGDVYWLDSRLSLGFAQAERHPCVVVQGDVFNSSRIATTVVCLINFNVERPGTRGYVALAIDDVPLSRPSVVNVSQLVTVDKIDLEERVGRLPTAALASVLTGLRLLFEGT